jgi:hypothetical protein
MAGHPSNAWFSIASNMSSRLNTHTISIWQSNTWNTAESSRPFVSALDPDLPYMILGPRGVAQAWCLFRRSKRAVQGFLSEAVGVFTIPSWWRSRGCGDFRSSGTQALSIALTTGARLGPDPSSSICLASFYKIYGKWVEGRIFTLSSCSHHARLLCDNPPRKIPYYRLGPIHFGH